MNDRTEHSASSRRRRLACAALLAAALVAWTRAFLYSARHDEVREVVASSGRLADSNRDFVLSAQDWLQWVWWFFPLLLLVLAFVVITLRVGEFVLVLVAGAGGVVPAVAGVLFPAPGPLQVLAGAFLVALATATLLTVLPGRR